MTPVFHRTCEKRLAHVFSLIPQVVVHIPRWDAQRFTIKLERFHGLAGMWVEGEVVEMRQNCFQDLIISAPAFLPVSFTRTPLLPVGRTSSGIDCSSFAICRRELALDRSKKSCDWRSLSARWSPISSRWKKNSFARMQDAFERIKFPFARSTFSFARCTRRKRRTADASRSMDDWFNETADWLGVSGQSAGLTVKRPRFFIAA